MTPRSQCNNTPSSMSSDKASFSPLEIISTLLSHPEYSRVVLFSVLRGLKDYSVQQRINFSLFYRNPWCKMLNELSRLVSQRIDKLRPPDGQIQSTFHVMLKDISVLKAYLLFTNFDRISSSKCGQQEMFIYIQVHGRAISIHLV